MLKDRLGDFQTRFELVLALHLPDIAGRQARIIEAMHYAVLGGGKRLRPFLLAETARIFDCAADSVDSAGAALEFVHVYSLIHDDLPCMDDDDMRRGKPTVHKAFDEAIAVLAGDALLTQGFEIMSGLPTDPQTALTLSRGLALASGTQGMIGGQVIDISVSEADRDAELISELQSLKTGALISFSVMAGAYLGGARANQVSSLSEYADALGLLFQITDDLLDVEGDPERVGKAVSKDENLGKATFVSILGLDGAKRRAGELL